MALRLELKQSQSLIITPQLQQSIKLLQLSSVDLQRAVERELTENPLLERCDDGPAAPEAQGEPAGGENGEMPGFDEQPADYDGGWEDAALTDIPEGNGGAPDNDSIPPAASGDQAQWASLRRSGTGQRSDGELPDIGNEQESLRQHLEDQLHLVTTDPAERLTGLHLIDMMDEAGYLRGDLDELAERLSAPPELIGRALALVQSLDPPGVGARNLSECLALQLREQNRLDPLIECLLGHLDLVAAHDFTRLARICKVDEQEVAEMVAEIRSLNPKPGLAFGHTPISLVIPDVFVRELPDGTWHVELNPETLPRLIVNRDYYAQVRSHSSKQDADYLKNCLGSADWLIKSLDQRARTILKVSREIVRHQQAFLRHGVHHLQPLMLRDIAEAVSMHESTISRATANKYMATPRGIFELRYFFGRAIAAAKPGEVVAAKSVQHRIKELIDAEPADKILSDDRIVSLLHAEGVDIARRTVAKYRDMMHIPSSRERRRIKRAMSLAVYSGVSEP